MLAEDSYGRRKRFDFVAESIRARSPERILDIGCGTGANLTLPLAKKFHHCQFLGTDVDSRSIASAKNAGSTSNVRFETSEALDEEQAFDLVIASEVLEHVEAPDEFLGKLRAKTQPGGRLIITVPNGYGPFEWCSLIEVLLNLSGLQKLLRLIKHRLVKPSAVSAATIAPTLAVSPHVNFFSKCMLLSMFEAAGFKVRRFRATTFLCGYGVDSLIRSGRVIAWNAAAADRLPAWCASDWMFELEPEPVKEKHLGCQKPWRPGSFGRFRRWLNKRRWSLT